MKHLLPFIYAVILFVCTCIGLQQYCNNIIADKQQELIYYNTDLRNSDKTALSCILGSSSIAVFGSSELSASDEVAYPPFLFQNGNSDFNMVLMGRGSMQSLHHAISLGALSGELANKKVVLILSPQWFTSSHLSSEAFASRFSERMYAEFLKNPYISYGVKDKVTERVKSLLASDETQRNRVEKYEQVYVEHHLNPLLHIEMNTYDLFMNLKQDFLLKNAISKVSYNEKEPVTVSSINFEELMNRAEQEGAEACTNNDLYIYNDYYDTYVRDSRDAQKGSQSVSSYLESPEYGDLSLFLQICKETGIEPLIISIPVNGWWYDWTGFPQENRAAYYQKIRDICGEYDAEIADFSDKEYEPYFLKDIMHLGWKGWVYLDETVYQFYKSDLE